MDHSKILPLDSTFYNICDLVIEHITCYNKKDFRLQVRMQGSYEAVEMSDQAGPETIEVTVYHFNIRELQPQ